MPTTLSLIAATIASAAAPVADAPPILVSARAPVTAADIGASVTVITADDIARLQAPLVLDVLRLAPGLSLSRNGGPGGFTAVRLRGAEGEQTTLVIDGVKVADVASPGGGADFGTLPAAHIARIEILRGPQSLAWGSQAIGGVIAIETIDPATAPPLVARLEGGSRQSVLATADAATVQGPLALSIGGNWQQTDGISAFAEARGGRERDDFETLGTQARATLALGAGFSLDARGRLQSSEFGVDGFPAPVFAFADTPDRGRQRDLSGAVGLRYDTDRVRLRAGWQDSQTRRRSFTPGRTPDTSFRSLGTLSRIDLRAEWDATAAVALSAGLEQERQAIETQSPSAFDPDPAPLTARASLTGGFLQAVLRPLPGLSALIGVRHDRHSDFGSATTLGASASYAIADGPTRVRASFGEGFKAPTLFQLFSDFGNSTLAAETAEGYDVGVDTGLADGTLRASATWFGRTTRNQIDFISCFRNTSAICAGRPFGTYDNIARTRSDGLELVLGATPTRGLTTDVSYTYTRTRNRTAGAGAGNSLPRRPAHLVNLVVDYVFAAGPSVGVTLTHQSESFDNASNSRRLPGFVTLDLRAAVPVTDRLSLTARMTNATDAQHETVFQYGQPGRQAFVGLRAQI